MSEPQPTTPVPEQVLDAATRLFAAHGYEGTSLSAIAEEVGIRKPSLLYHYPSKEELREAVLGRLFSHWTEVLPRILQAATTGSSRFEGLVGEVVGFFVADVDRARLLLREMLDRPVELQRQMDGYLAPWLTIIRDYIRTGQESGVVRADVDPDSYIVHVIQMIVGGIATSNVIAVSHPDDDRADLERHVAEIVRIARSSLFIDTEP